MAKEKKARKKKAAAKKESTGKRGRTSAHAGLHITKLVKTEETGLRATGKVRQCWDAITNGCTFEKYVEKAAVGGLAGRVIAHFIKSKFVKLS